MSIIYKKYGMAGVIPVPLITAGTTKMMTADVSGAWVANDIQRKLDNGSFVVRDNTDDPTFKGRGWFDVDMDADDLTAKIIILSFIDQDIGSEEFEDQNVIILTYGHANAQIATDLDLENLNVNIKDVNGVPVGSIADFKATVSGLATQVNIGTASGIDGNPATLVDMVKALFSADNGATYVKATHSLQAIENTIGAAIGNDQLATAYTLIETTGVISSGSITDTETINNTLLTVSPFGGQPLNYTLKFKTDTVDTIPVKLIFIMNYEPNVSTEYVRVLIKNVFTGQFVEFTSKDYRVSDSSNRIHYGFDMSIEFVNITNGEVEVQLISTDTDILSVLDIDFAAVGYEDIYSMTVNDIARGLVTRKANSNLLGGDTIEGLLHDTIVFGTTLQGVSDAKTMQLTGSYQSNQFVGHPIRIQDKNDLSKVETGIIQTFDASGNLVLKTVLSFTPTPLSTAKVLFKSSIESEGTDGVTLDTAQGNYTPALAGDQMNLVDNAITSGKFDESTAFPLKSDDLSNTQVGRTGTDGDTLKTLSDQLDNVSSQISGIGVGATTFQVLFPSQSVVPLTSFLMYRVDVLYKTSGGVPQDPDNQDIVIQIKDVNGFDKVVLFDDNLATTPATASINPAFAGFYDMVRTGVGQYFTFYKVDSTEAKLQWSINFLLEQTAVLIPFGVSTLLVDSLTAEVNLAATTSNYDVLATGNKGHDSSAISTVAGSIHKEILDDNALQTLKIDDVQDSLDDGTDGLGAIKAQTQSIENKVNIIGSDVDTINTTTTTTANDVINIETKVDAGNNATGSPPNFGSGGTLADNNRDLAGATFNTGTDSQESIRNKLDTTLSASMDAVNGDVQSAINLGQATGIMEPGIVDTSVISATTTTFSSDISHPIPQAFTKRSIYFLTGNNIKQYTKILNYVNVSGKWVFTTEEVTSIPVNGDTFLVI